MLLLERAGSSNAPEPFDLVNLVLCKQCQPRSALIRDATPPPLGKARRAPRSCQEGTMGEAWLRLDLTLSDITSVALALISTAASTYQVRATWKKGANRESWEVPLTLPAQASLHHQREFKQAERQHGESLDKAFQQHKEVRRCACYAIASRPDDLMRGSMITIYVGACHGDGDQPGADREWVVSALRGSAGTLPRGDEGSRAGHVGATVS
jgi:hypothetical protein